MTDRESASANIVESKFDEISIIDLLLRARGSASQSGSEALAPSLQALTRHQAEGAAGTVMQALPPNLLLPVLRFVNADAPQEQFDWVRSIISARPPAGFDPLLFTLAKFLASHIAMCFSPSLHAKTEGVDYFDFAVKAFLTEALQLAVDRDLLPFFKSSSIPWLVDQVVEESRETSPSLANAFSLIEQCLTDDPSFRQEWHRISKDIQCSLLALEGFMTSETITLGMLLSSPRFPPALAQLLQQPKTLRSLEDWMDAQSGPLAGLDGWDDVKRLTAGILSELSTNGEIEKARTLDRIRRCLLTPRFGRFLRAFIGTDESIGGPVLPKFFVSLLSVAWGKASVFAEVEDWIEQLKTPDMDRLLRRILPDALEVNVVKELLLLLATRIRDWGSGSPHRFVRCSDIVTFDFGEWARLRLAHRQTYAAILSGVEIVTCLFRGGPRHIFDLLHYLPVYLILGDNSDDVIVRLRSMPMSSADWWHSLIDGLAEPGGRGMSLLSFLINACWAIAGKDDGSQTQFVKSFLVDAMYALLGFSPTQVARSCLTSLSAEEFVHVVRYGFLPMLALPACGPQDADELALGSLTDLSMGIPPDDRETMLLFRLVGLSFGLVIDTPSDLVSDLLDFQAEHPDSSPRDRRKALNFKRFLRNLESSKALRPYELRETQAHSQPELEPVTSPAEEIELSWGSHHHLSGKIPPRTRACINSLLSLKGCIQRIEVRSQRKLVKRPHAWVDKRQFCMINAILPGEQFALDVSLRVRARSQAQQASALDLIMKSLHEDARR